MLTLNHNALHETTIYQTWVFQIRGGMNVRGHVPSLLAARRDQGFPTAATPPSASPQDYEFAQSSIVRTLH
ncbi:hypothetical protein HBI56_223300 [Parastagonospora nodorum]|uniref:Uncharacterized protein n=1 Tax=Phaeosphaeria nodorum (strain SN15 / ATCC MYA-4574 / FGSC 10173) TaxID=321614 RepID=A0A7U2EY61_PHANO|nr:hypothetical protein HBH56_147690 [Parastagonospora nodorum]QRC94053.1 hypothetical protein JI435_073340 [Parastagonospora nodorum SN15]KAH3923306.1 hypothetical protein HBH54_212330 [Parastagonospora nodorum]KAH3945896.1 hypothetical protein HBH53_135150 [Parastagonospora nodorum]KAH3983862.1 hypothetical protein HBH52_064890 [Parastagonospora nodorum]